MYWFPCIDHPRVKFSSEISVIVPIGFRAISNGILLKVEKQDKKQIYRWSETNPHPAYLTSVVVGEYVEMKDGKNLYYYVPPEKKEDALRSFVHTPEIIRFFEEYLGTNYPYDKYSQVTVQDFVYGGIHFMTKKHTLTLQVIILYHMSWHTNGLATLSHAVIGSISGSMKDLPPTVRHSTGRQAKARMSSSTI
jgi:aminopeptidase N